MRRLLPLLILLAFPVAAADRHVYLNTGAGTQLNDCPNPAHNVKTTSNTDELVRCTDVTPNKFYCTGTCASWTRDCTAGNRANVVNGDTVDVDGDGTGEVVYGHPQACVWDMAQSDSCEVHAGTYKKPGAHFTAAGVGTNDTVCDRSDCWYATVFASGSGPNLAAAGYPGYGTAQNPGYLRGAVMNGSTDTWDPDGDKFPGGTTYPAIFDGDADGDSVFWEGYVAGATPTDQNATDHGDAFFAYMIGCEHGTTDSFPCVTNLNAGQQRPWIDKNADGTFSGGEELATGNGTSLIRSVSYLTIKDIEMAHYNGGPTTCTGNGIRDFIGSIQLSGAGSNGSGLVDGGNALNVDHVYWHDGDHTNGCETGGGANTEAFVAIIGDNENNASSVPSVISNSYFIQQNRYVVDDDCGEYGQCGTSKTFHDNRFLIPPLLADGSAWPTAAGDHIAFYRMKSHDTLVDGTVPKVLRVYNNEFIFQAIGTQWNFVFNECMGQCWHDQKVYTECTAAGVPWACCTGSGAGTCRPELYTTSGQGELWVYGNIFRAQGTVTTNWQRAFQSFCDVSCSSNNSLCLAAGSPWACCTGAGTGNNCNGCVPAAGKRFVRIFNNTFDMEKTNGTGSSGSMPFEGVCNPGGTTASAVHVFKNNAVFGLNTVNADDTATVTDVRTNNVCNTLTGTTSCTDGTTTRASWWGNHTKNSAITDTLANYVPADGGVLHEKTTNNPCDPDADGVAGANWYGTGNVTTWTDIAGNVVSCPTSATALSLGAVQFNSDAAATAKLRGGKIRGGKIR